MAWIRFYTDILDDIQKTRKLSANSYQIFTFLLLYAKELESNGEINLPLEDIKWRLRVDMEILKTGIDDLKEVGILSNKHSGIKFVNWSKRQFSESYERVKKHREKKRYSNGNCNADETDCNKSVTDTRAREQNRTDTETPIVPLKGDVVNSLPSDGIPYAEILQDLVEKTGLKIDFTAEATLKQIRVLWRKGYTLEDFKYVHMVKAAQWGNDGAKRPWLHPNTLYKDSKFDVYRNEEAPIIEGQEPWRF